MNKINIFIILNLYNSISMSHNRSASIQMPRISPKQIPLLHTLDQPKNLHQILYQPEFNRVTGNIICFWIITLCTTAIPAINLLLFFLQPFELARGINPNNITVSNFGRLNNFTYFYIVAGAYGLISAIFIIYSNYFTNLWQRFKLYVMVDNIMICMLATNIAYAALHIVSFTAVYSTDQQYNLVPEIVVYWQDYLIIALYSTTNLAYVGIFRVLMVNIYWKPWQTLVYKLSIIISSLLYIAIGLVYIFGNDSLSKQVDDFNAQIDPVINYCYNHPNFFNVIPLLQRQQSSLANAQNKINGFVLLYVFTNFAFSFEVVAKLTDFDGTADLKTGYLLKEQKIQ